MVIVFANSDSKNTINQCHHDNPQQIVHKKVADLTQHSDRQINDISKLFNDCEILHDLNKMEQWDHEVDDWHVHNVIYRE